MAPFIENEHVPYITHLQLCAAVEVFGRDVKLAPLERTSNLIGAFDIKTVGELHDLFANSLAEGPNGKIDRPLIENELAICRFYDENKKLTAIGIAPSLNENEMLEITLSAQGPSFVLVDGESNTPDPDIIILEAWESGISVKTKPVKLDIYPASIGERLTDDDQELFRPLIDYVLPPRPERDAQVEAIRKTVTAVPLILV